MNYELLRMMSNNLDAVADTALLLVAVATVSMTFLELVKALSRARLYFHRWQIRSWIRTQAAKGADTDRIWKELLILAAGIPENESALFDQPSGKLMGQIQAAVNVALDFPTRYAALYKFLRTPPDAEPPGDDGQLWMKFTAAKYGFAPDDDAASAEPLSERDSRRASAKRALDGNLVARKLDALQTRIEYLWARANQLLSVLLGAFLLLYLLLQSNAWAVTPQAVFMSLLGGMISPFAKDIVAALAGLRRKGT
jgi:hypothetical protein